jgi:hypothetical protein
MIGEEFNWKVISFSPCSDWDAVFYDPDPDQIEERFYKDRIVGFAVAADADDISHIKPVIQNGYDDLVFADTVSEFVGLLHKDVTGIPENMKLAYTP